MGMTSSESQEGAGSQTLDRGIRILELLAEAGGGLTTAEITRRMGLHRSIIYRLLRTLEQHRLVVRDEQGLARLGARLATLASGVARDIQSAALPALRTAAQDLEATCFLVAFDHGDVVTLVSVEPSRTKVTVAEHPGTLHPLGVGAPGRAVLALMPEDQWPRVLGEAERAEAHRVAQLGYAASFSEVIPGLRSVAVPLSAPGHVPMAVAVVYVSGDRAEHLLAQRLVQAVGDILAVLEA